MSQEFYDIQLTISELKEKLKLIKATLKPLIHNGKVPPGLIPYDIREEIVKIYDEHGGILKLAE